jgi:hypothetical protein
MQEPLSDDDRKRLDELNNAVKVAIETRRDWLDSKMPEYAEMQIGDDVYDLDSCVKVGKVSELYRYWRDRDKGVRDDSLSIEYEFETRPNCFDNTSRLPGVVGSRAQAKDIARARLESVSRKQPG